jgi:WD40 repeat protein
MEPEGDLNLETFASLMEGGKRGPAVVPSKPDEGRLVRMIEGKLKPVMPPKKSRQPTSAEIAKVRAWVLAGAKDDGGTLKVTLPKLAPRMKLAPPVLAVAASPDGNHVAAGGRGEVVILTPAGDVAARHALDRDRVTALAYGGSRLAVAASTAGVGHDVRLFPDAKVVLKHDDTIQALAFSPDGRWLATASYDRLIRLWDVMNTKAGPVLKDHSDSVYGVAFSPDGKLLVSGGADRAIKVWDVATGTRLYTLGESTDWVYAVAWSPAGDRLAAAGVDKSIRVWEVDRSGGKVALSAFAHEGPVVRLAYSRDGKTLVSIGEDRVLKVWDAATLTERKVHPAQPDACLSLALSADEKLAYVGRYDGALMALETLSGKVAGQLLPVKPLVERFPGVGEAEPNDSSRTGQKVMLPVTVNGSIGRPGDVDWFRFDAKAGDEIGVMVKPADKAQLDPLLRLVDPDGETVAEGTTGTLGKVIDKAGTYAVGVWDREYRGGEKATYKLHVGPIPVITSVFPLGVPRGAVSEVRVEGVNLGKERTVKVNLGPAAVPGLRVPIKVGSAESSVLVGEFPEVRAGTPIPTPGTANGLIAKAGSSETWTFAAKKGRRVILEVSANRIGSPLDSSIEILDEKGRPLPRAVLRSLARTYTVFRDHDSRGPGIRIETWGELAVNDLMLVGNELLKIRALPRNPDDDCQFFQEGGRRAGYLGTTPTHQSVGTPMYKVSVHPPGTTFPPNGLPLVTLFWRNDDGTGTGRDSRLAFDPPADGTYKVRVTDARGEGGPAHAYRLTVREPRPDFSVSLSPASPTVFPGGATPVQVNVTRIDEFDGTIDVELKNLPAGLSAPKTNIGPDDTATSVALFAEAGVKLPAKMQPIEVVARAKVDGKEVVRTAAGGTAKIGKSADILTTTEQPEATIRPGGEAKVTVTIERRNGFAGRVPLEVRGLPHGVRVLDVGLNGILIIPGETKRTFVLYAEPWVKAVDHPIVVFARREGKPEEYAAKSVLLHVK